VNNRSGRLLIVRDREVLAALERLLGRLMAGLAGQLEDDLLSDLGILVEHRPGLATESLLLHVIAPSALRCLALLAFLVLGHLAFSVLPTLFAEGPASLGYCNHRVHVTLFVVCCLLLLSFFLLAISF